jgi:apolipoprotein N-acyltransferase
MKKDNLFILLSVVLLNIVFYYMLRPFSLSLNIVFFLGFYSLIFKYKDDIRKIIWINGLHVLLNSFVFNYDILNVLKDYFKISQWEAMPLYIFLNIFMRIDLLLISLLIFFMYRYNIKGKNFFIALIASITLPLMHQGYMGYSSMSLIVSGYQHFNALPIFGLYFYYFMFFTILLLLINKRWKNVIVHLCIIILFSCFSFKQKTTKEVNVGMIQFYKQNFTKETPKLFLTEYNKKVTNLIKERNKNPDLIVFPENSTPVRYNDYQLYSKEKNYRELISLKIPLIMNTYRNFKNHSWNSTYYIQPNKIPQIYNKLNLFPFGEKDILFWNNFYPKESTGLIPGNKSKTFQLKEINIIPLICFEIYSNLFVHDQIKINQDKNNIIMISSNESWMKKEYYKNINNTVVAVWAKIYGIPIVKVDSTGPSIVSDFHGNIIKRIPMNKISYQEVNIKIPQQNSLFSQFGVGLFLLFIVFYLIIKYFINILHR